jgi:hypothetical protein
MRVYFFTEEIAVPKNCYRPERIRTVLEKAAEATDTGDLVVAVYLLSNTAIWGGLMVTGCLSPPDFYHGSGRDWAFVRRFGLPEDLPEQYKLIRMVLSASARYPTTTKDTHGWRLRFQSFDDHVAYVFAHELHHFRRYHLGLHPGEGEQSAGKWAVQRSKEAGFQVEGIQIRRRKRLKAYKKDIRIPQKRNPKLVQRVKLIGSQMHPEDLTQVVRWMENRILKAERPKKQKELAANYEKLRALPDETLVRIVQDNEYKSEYVGQTATKIRTLRRDSHRLQVRTRDGKKWRWLEAID